LSLSKYVGDADTVKVGEMLPPGCVVGTILVPTTTHTTTPVVVPDNSVTTGGCGKAIDNGEYPNVNDNHSVWNNAPGKVDGSFGVTSPIFLENLTTDGHHLGTLTVPSDEVVTSFSSKSELALNRSTDGKVLTFVAYRGGPGCPATTFGNI